MKKRGFFLYLFVITTALLLAESTALHARTKIEPSRVEKILTKENKTRLRWEFRGKKLKEQQEDPRKIILLDVPFIPQVPPGEWGKTNNCGQTAFLMIYCYYHSLAPVPEQIKEIDDWLYEHLDLPVNNYNGSKTISVFIESLARGYGKMSYVKTYTGSSLDRVRNLLKKGHPVKASIRYPSPGNPEKLINHAVVIIGISKSYIFIHDPGTVRGKAVQYDIADFLEYWEGLGRRITVFTP